MAIRPTRIFSDSRVELWHDERGHGGIVTLVGIRFGRRLDGSIDPRYIEIDCPVTDCGSTSYHPITGGSAPREVQRLFVARLLQIGTIPPAVATRLGLADGDVSTFAKAKAAVIAVIRRMEGDERVRVSDLTE